MEDDLALPDFDHEISDLDLDLDLGAFDIGLGGEEVANRYVKPPLYRHVPAHAVSYNNAKAMARDMMPDIVAGERVDALVGGNFIFGDFIEAFAVEANVTIDDLTISTLALSEENVDSLRNLMIGGFLTNLNLLVSDYFWSHNRASAPYIYRQLDIGDRFQLAVAGVHAKVALLNVEGRKIIVTGSANLRSARCVEVFTVETNADLYDFHAAWIGKLMEAYATIRKSIRAGEAYDLITGAENVSKHQRKNGNGQGQQGIKTQAVQVSAP